MTGGYLRVQRDGSWQSVEVEHLTDEERETVLKNDPRLMQWLHLTCHKLAELQPLLDDLEKVGVIQQA